MVTVNVSACSGISKTNSATNSEIEVYPNLSSGQFELKEAGSSKINYHVYDLLGKEVLSGQMNENKSFDLSSQSNGTCIIRLKIGTVMTYKKLIVEK